ncbi:hypothetical protein D3C72_589840 [compost metagenome]
MTALSSPPAAKAVCLMPLSKSSAFSATEAAPEVWGSSGNSTAGRPRRVNLERRHFSVTSWAESAVESSMSELGSLAMISPRVLAVRAIEPSWRMSAGTTASRPTSRSVAVSFRPLPSVASLMWVRIGKGPRADTARWTA